MTTKTKISNFAKDIGVKSKDIVELLKENGIEGKSTSSALEHEELNIILQHYTLGSKVDDLGAYLSSKKSEQAKPAEKSEKKEVKPEKAEAAPAKETAESAAPAAETKAAEVKEEKQPAQSVKAETETARTAAENEKDEIKAQDAPQNALKNAFADKKPAVSDERRPQNNGGDFRRPNDRPDRFQNNRFGAQQTYQNGGISQNRPARDGFSPNAGAANNNGQFQQRRPFDPNRKPPFGQQQRPGFGANPRFGNNNAAPGQLSERQLEKQISKISKEGAQLAKQDGRPVEHYPKFDKNDKFDKYTNVKFTKDGFVNVEQPSANKAPSKPKFQKNNFYGQNRDKDEDSQSVRQPSLKPVFDKDGHIRSRYAGTRIEGAAPAVDSEGKVVVDIRTSEVDLSKYDERLDNLVPDALNNERAPKSAKKKAQNGIQKGVGGRINRNEAAARDFMPSGNGKNRRGKQNKNSAPAEPVKKFTGPITLPEEIMISDLAAKLKITTGEVIKKLLAMGLGMDAVGANKMVDYDTAYLLADELGIAAEKEVVLSIEDKLFAEDEAEESDENLVPRSPVVCVMGHVDHGKTSLLDAIRHTNVTAGEAGGITQHIGAYRVHINDRDITFLDTPGHEAFTAMRARGAQATDIAILVVAADDGIMPQTIEAINHAKAAGVTVIVAINKIDKPGANIEAVKQNLTTYDLVPEEWGGDTICVPVSALKRQGIEELLEMVLLVADMKELKANPNCSAKGIVIEAKLDKGRGPVATVLVQSGTLRRGDVVIAGTAVGHVRAMTDYTGRSVKEAGPSVPVELTGLSEAPEGGDEFRVVADERMAKELVEQRKARAKEEVFKANAKVSLDTLFDRMAEGVKDLAIIVKADVQGSAEAVKASLEKLSNDEVRVKVIHSATGGITESDVMLASASNAIIVGFNVRPDKNAMDSAEAQNVDIRTYRVIYECIEEITAAINGMLDPEFKEVVLGHAQVRKTIHVPGIGFVAGSYVQDGKILRSSQIRVVRDGVVIFEDKIASLRRFKDDVKEVAQGYECGIALERFNDIKENDVLEAFIMEEVKRSI